MTPRPPLRTLLGLLLLLIGYGSLFPFEYVPHEPGLADLRHLLTEWPAHLSTSDVVGNVLLFLPLGLLIPVIAPRSGARVAWIVFGVGYAWLLQYIQFWYPSRDPVGSDAVFNCLGIALGLLLASAMRSAARQAGRQLDLSDPFWAAATVWLLLWVAYRWFPLVPTLDLDNVKTALKPLLLHPEWDAPRVLHDTAAWLLWFWLARHAPLRPLGRPWVMGAAALAILAAEPVFVYGAISLSNVLGLLLALLLAPLLRRGGEAATWVLLALLAASITVSGLVPFTFYAAHEFLWLPFAGMLSGSMVLNTASLLEKCYLYGGMLLLLARLGFGWKLAAFVLAAQLALIEWLQLALPGRTAEITDPILALVLAIGIRGLLGVAGRPALAHPVAPAPRVRGRGRRGLHHRADPLR